MCGLRGLRTLWVEAQDVAFAVSLTSLTMLAELTLKPERSIRHPTGAWLPPGLTYLVWASTAALPEQASGATCDCCCVLPGAAASVASHFHPLNPHQRPLDPTRCYNAGRKP